MSVIGMLEELAMPAGSTLLQTAANSTLGQMVIQQCKTRGLNCINVVRREEAKAELLKIFGDECQVVVLDAKAPMGFLKDRVNEIVKRTGIQAPRYAIDAVGGPATSHLISAVASHSTILLYGLQSGETSAISSADFIFRDVTVRGFWLLHYMTKKKPEESVKLFQSVFEMFKTGTMRPSVERTYGLEEWKDAFRDELGAGKARKGKLLFDLSKL